MLEAALLTHMGHVGLGEKALGPVAMEQADRLGATSMINLCRAALYADGRDVPTGRMELVKAALSTLSLPTVLGNVANKVLLDHLSRCARPAGARTISHYLRAVASLGGYLGRRRDGPPGNMVLWRGLSKLTDIHLGFEIAATIVGN